MREGPLYTYNSGRWGAGLLLRYYRKKARTRSWAREPYRSQEPPLANVPPRPLTPDGAITTPLYTIILRVHVWPGYGRNQTIHTRLRHNCLQRSPPRRLPRRRDPRRTRVSHRPIPTRRQTDAYSGSIENRVRFGLEPKSFTTIDSCLCIRTYRLR